MAPSKQLTGPVGQARKRLRGAPMRLGKVPVPTTPVAERRLREQMLNANKQIARMVAQLEEVVDDLKEVQQLREKECLRWQANHDLVLAWTQQRIVHFEEQALALGIMRKEQPPCDRTRHTGWQLVAVENLRDSSVKKRAREAEKLLDRLIEEHPDTVWAELAQKAQRTPLSVEWHAVK
jgi:hypothetical protein